MFGKRSVVSSTGFTRLATYRRRLLGYRTWLAIFTAVLAGVMWSGDGRVVLANDPPVIEQAGSGKLAVVGAQGADLYGAPDGVVARTLAAWRYPRCRAQRR